MPRLMRHMIHSPIRRHPRRIKATDSPIYRDWIASLPCLICFRELYLQGLMFDLIEADRLALRQPSSIQQSPTECAHVGVRGLGQKCPDRQTVPLCAEHHRTGKSAHHVLGRNFWTFHGLDRDQLIRQLNSIFDSKRIAA